MRRKPRYHPYGIIDPFKIPKIADKLLNEYWDIAEDLNIKTFLIYGTCLGFVRDGGYIERDNDIDVGILGEIGELEIKLTENGFVKKRKWPPTNYHFLKYNVLLDIFTGFEEPYWRYFKSFDKVIYKDRIYNVPHPVEGYLKTLFGDWEIRKLRA